MKISIALGMLLICAEGLVGSAHAYCRRSSCEGKPARVCVPETTSDCGVPVRWADKLIAYDVAAATPGTTDYAAAIQRGFAAWAAVDCGDGRHPALAVVPHVVPAPEATPSRGHVVVGDVAIDPREGRLALTTLRFSQKNGAVSNARTTFYDVPLKGHDAAFVDALALHEAGHFLGLAHSDDKDAVMAAEVHDGAAQRAALADDDVAAICATFPPAGGPIQGKLSPAVLGGLVAGSVAALGALLLWWLKRRPTLRARGRR